jgi:aminoglycoside phosphotransferase (APT) family kinase protein
MFASKEPPRLEIPASTVEKLIEEQFPQWAHLPVKAVESSGWDNRTFHLGNEMSVRLPSAERYIHQVRKEQEWLPKLAPRLSFSIPTPLAMGKPSESYPWHWSIYKWIEGKNANTLNSLELDKFAEGIAEFLIELQCIPSKDGPVPGPFYRGASPRHYDAQTREAISSLQDVVDVDGAISTWEAAIISEWKAEPVWVHGDFSAGNILVNDGKLTAVIDFGSCCVGDPACDLVIAWTLLTDSARKAFKEKLELDKGTWARARGWAIWKALITLADLKDQKSFEAEDKLKIISLVINDHKIGTKELP